jgi:hypothetical protein
LGHPDRDVYPPAIGWTIEPQSQQNSSSRYLIIERSEVSDAQTSNDEIFWTLNPDFNAIRF